MILILDTDTLTVLQRQTEPYYSRLRAQLAAFPQDDVRTTVVSFEEQMRGWLSAIAGAKNEVQELAAYERLYNLLAFFSSIPVLAYDHAAAEHFAALRLLRLNGVDGSQNRCGHYIPERPLTVAESQGLQSRT
jgi:tRNA(fMet)-specific endonuclease VapC